MMISTGKNKNIAGSVGVYSAQLGKNISLSAYVFKTTKGYKDVATIEMSNEDAVVFAKSILAQVERSRFVNWAPTYSAVMAIDDWSESLR